MIVAHAPVPGFGIITNWDFNAPMVTPLGGVQLVGDQPWEVAPSGELSLEGISDVFAALQAGGWAYEHRKWLVGGGLALAAFGAWSLLR